MKYYLDLFSPETYEAFGRSDRTVSGFRVRQRNAASRIEPGDKLLCYMTKLSRWFGILDVLEGPFIDDTPIFYPEDDPFVVRFRVRPEVWLPIDKAVPIHEDRLWEHLSFTAGQDKNTSTWTGKIRASLAQLSDDDGRLLETVIRAQSDGGESFPVDEVEYRRHLAHRVRRVDKDVTVTVPDDTEPTHDPAAPTDVRESIRIQATLADIGSRMGMQIWIPRADRTAVLTEWSGDHPPVLDRLPLNCDDTTLRTIEQIDVL